jgi:hypothetical protein
MKTDGHLGRCYLKDRHGDAANAILSAVGYNLRLVFAWLRIVLRLPAPSTHLRGRVQIGFLANNYLILVSY